MKTEKCMGVTACGPHFPSPNLALCVFFVVSYLLSYLPTLSPPVRLDYEDTLFSIRKMVEVLRSALYVYVCLRMLSESPIYLFVYTPLGSISIYVLHTYVQYSTTKSYTKPTNHQNLRREAGRGNSDTT